WPAPPAFTCAASPPTSCPRAWRRQAWSASLRMRRITNWCSCNRPGKRGAGKKKAHLAAGFPSLIDDEGGLLTLDLTRHCPESIGDNSIKRQPYKRQPHDIRLRECCDHAMRA